MERRKILTTLLVGAMAYSGIRMANDMSASVDLNKALNSNKKIEADINTIDGDIQALATVHQPTLEDQAIQELVAKGYTHPALSFLQDKELMDEIVDNNYLKIYEDAKNTYSDVISELSKLPPSVSPDNTSAKFLSDEKGEIPYHGYIRNQETAGYYIKTLANNLESYTTVQPRAASEVENGLKDLSEYVLGNSVENDYATSKGENEREFVLSKLDQIQKSLDEYQDIKTGRNETLTGMVFILQHYEAYLQTRADNNAIDTNIAIALESATAISTLILLKLERAKRKNKEKNEEKKKKYIVLTDDGELTDSNEDEKPIDLKSLLHQKTNRR